MSKGKSLKDGKQKNKYPAYYFILAVLLIYFTLIRPGNELFEGLFYLFVLSVATIYLYYKINEDPEIRRQRLQKIEEGIDKREKELNKLGLPLEPQKRKFYQNKGSLSKHFSKKKSKSNNQIRDIHIDCECEDHIGNNCTNHNNG